jgi:hypothetical protein
MDTAQLSKSNLLYLNHSLYKKIKSGKKIVLNLKGEALEFTKSKNTETDLPINEAGLKFKVLNATSKDKKWVISIIDNEFFPLILFNSLFRFARILLSAIKGTRFIKNS